MIDFPSREGVHGMCNIIMLDMQGERGNEAGKSGVMKRTVIVYAYRSLL